MYRAEVGNDTRVILFVKPSEGVLLTEEFVKKIKDTIRQNTHPHHMPAKVIATDDIPYTINMKRVGDNFFWEHKDFNWEEYAFLRAHLETTTMFYGKLVFQDKDVAYHGELVTSDDPGLPLLRWKISDNEYRVLFGDLRIDNVSADELASLESILNSKDMIE